MRYKFVAMISTGFVLTLTFIFTILKLGGVISWGWGWVLSPLWITVVASIEALVLCAIAILLIEGFTELKRKVRGED